MALYIRQNSEWKQVSSTGFGAGTGDVTPIGTIAIWSGSIATIPESHGWYLCDGGTYGGVTTPDLRDKFVVGAHSDGASGVTFNADTGAISGNYAPGNTGGSVAHQLTLDEIPQHRHTAWRLTDQHDADGSGYEVWRYKNTTDYYTGYAGGDDYHENRPPYYALAYIMKCVATGSGGDFGGDGVAGTDGQIQYNDNGVVGGASTFFYDDSNDRVGIGTDSPTTILELLSSASEVIRVGSGTNESAISFKHNNIDGGLVQVGSRDSYFTVWTKDGSNATSTRRFDITNTGAWLLGGSNSNDSDGYGQSGQVLTSNADGAPTWQDSTGSVDSITITQTNYSTSCTNPITTSGPTSGAIDIAIASTSNAYGTRRIQSSATAPTASDGCDGDIWYTPGTSGSGGGSGGGDPVGTIVAWGGSVANIPSEYQLCDGSAASTAALQAITGANVPDLRDKFVVGAHSDAASGVTFNATTGAITGNYAPGNSGGSVAHQLTIAEMPSHTHPYTNSDAYWVRNTSVTNNEGITSGGLEFTTRNAVNAQGGSNYHENRPPYYALCYIIKHTATSGSGGSGGSLVNHGTVATTSGTEAAFTNIPSTAKKITVAIHNFGYAGTISELIMHVGDSTGYYTSTNDYQSSYDNRDLDPNAQSRTDAYGLADSTANDVEYNITVELVNVTGNSWTISHTGGANASSGAVMYGGGSISLSNALDRLRIKTADGNTLDHGHITVYYETEGSGSGSGGGTDAGQGFFTNDTTLTTSTTLPSNKNVGIFGPYTIGNNVTLTVPTGTTFTIV